MQDLDAFLAAAKAGGATDSFLVALLKQQGWPERAVYEALGRHYAASTGLPLPQPRSSLESAREAFYHLLAFGTLGVWICAIGSIWFTLIDHWLPDAASYNLSGWRIRQISWQIAAILVSFPVFALATRSIVADLKANPEKTASGVRRWLTNFALLIAALVFIGDLVASIAVFLQGEITARFLAKSAVVLLLSGAVFAYYSRGIGMRDSMPAPGWHMRFAWIAAALIVLTLGVGFSTTGSPANQRLLAEDRRRVQDLYRIAQAIHDGWTGSPPAERRLPETMEAINEGTPRAPLVLKDPFTQQPYRYEPQENGRYRLCATFQGATLSGEVSSSWSHSAGEHCFSLDASRFPPATPF